MDTLQLKPIGVIRTSFTQSAGTPLHPVYAEDALGTIEVEPEYAAGLADLTGFSRIWLLFWCHRAKPVELLITPYRDLDSHGVLATRVPSRPNPIGLSAVRLVSVKGSVVKVSGVDMLDGSPLLDIKPYVPDYDCFPAERSGWVGASSVAAETLRADSRFERSAE